MMQGSTTHGLLLAPMLGGRRVLGWVAFLVLPQCNSNSLTEKVLVHLVLPRWEVFSVKFLGRKSTSHLSIHDGRLVCVGIKC